MPPQQFNEEQKSVLIEFGKLYVESQLWSPKEKRLDVLKEQIRSWYPDLKPDETATAIVGCYEIQVGEKPIEKKWISMSAVCKAVGGLKVFLTICEVTFAALASKLGNAKAAALQVEERTGKRRVKAVVLAPAVKLPKAA